MIITNGDNGWRVRFPTSVGIANDFILPRSVIAIDADKHFERTCGCCVAPAMLIKERPVDRPNWVAVQERDCLCFVWPQPEWPAARLENLVFSSQNEGPWHIV